MQMPEEETSPYEEARMNAEVQQLIQEFDAVMDSADPTAALLEIRQDLGPRGLALTHLVSNALGGIFGGPLGDESLSEELASLSAEAEEDAPAASSAPPSGGFQAASGLGGVFMQGGPSGGAPPAEEAGEQPEQASEGMDEDEEGITRLGTFPVGEPNRLMIRISRREFIEDDNSPFQDISVDPTIYLSPRSHRREQGHTQDRSRYAFPGPEELHPRLTLLVQHQYTMDLPPTLGPWKPYQCHCPRCLDHETPLMMFKYLGMDPGVPPQAWRSLIGFIQAQLPRHAERRYIQTAHGNLVVWVTPRMNYQLDPIRRAAQETALLNHLMDPFFRPAFHGNYSLSLRPVQAYNRTVSSVTYSLWKL